MGLDSRIPYNLLLRGIVVIPRLIVSVMAAGRHLLVMDGPKDLNVLAYLSPSLGITSPCNLQGNNYSHPRVTPNLN